MCKIQSLLLIIFSLNLSLLNAYSEHPTPFDISTQAESDSEEFTDVHLPRTDPKEVAFLYQILKVLDIEFSKHGIPYWIDFDSLLGAKRHGGIIPWDDDIDICVMATDIDKVRSLTTIFTKYGLILWQRQPLPWKLHRPGQPHFCVDIFFQWEAPNDPEGKLSFHSNWTGFWYEDEVRVLERIPFGPIKVSAPAIWSRRIFTQYGEDCMEKAFFHSHTHGPIDGKFTIVDFSPAKYIVDPKHMIIPLDH